MKASYDKMKPVMMKFAGKKTPTDSISKTMNKVKAKAMKGKWGKNC